MRSTLAVPDSQWYLLRLANMSTLLREWIALHLTQTLVCADSILGQPVRPCHPHCLGRASFHTPALGISEMNALCGRNGPAQDSAHTRKIKVAKHDGAHSASFHRTGTPDSVYALSRCTH